MIEIRDFKQSRPHRASPTETWVWEVIINIYDEEYNEDINVIIARFFDPWKAIKHGEKFFDLKWTVQASLEQTDNLTG